MPCPTIRRSTTAAASPSPPGPDLRLSHPQGPRNGQEEQTQRLTVGLTVHVPSGTYETHGTYMFAARACRSCPQPAASLTSGRGNLPFPGVRRGAPHAGLRECNDCDACFGFAADDLRPDGAPGQGRGPCCAGPGNLAARLQVAAGASADLAAADRATLRLGRSSHAEARGCPARAGPGGEDPSPEDRRLERPGRLCCGNWTSARRRPSPAWCGNTVRRSTKHSASGRATWSIGRRPGTASGRCGKRRAVRPSSKTG